MKIKISKPGVDVLTATSPNDFYLHSDYPLLKVHSYGTFSILSQTTLTIYHNLGYKPYVITFSQFIDFDFSTWSEVVSSEYYQHDWLIEGATIVWWGRTDIYDDRIEIKVGNTNAFKSVALGFYYIFKEEI